MGEALIAVGGVIPEQDFEPLREAGVDAIFPPGTVIAEAAASLIDQLNQRLGYTQRGPSVSAQNAPKRVIALNIRRLSRREDRFS